MLEIIAGKTRSAIASSILQSPELLENAYESASNSTGSAMEELAVYSDSIDAKIQNITNAWQKLWHDTLDTGVIKTILDIGSALLGVVDKIGLINTLIPTIMTSLSAFGNKGVFTTIDDFSTKSGKKIQILGNTMEEWREELSKIKETISDLFSGGDDFENLLGDGEALESFMDALQNGSSREDAIGQIIRTDTDALNSYIEALRNGVTQNDAMTQYMTGASEATRQQAQSIDAVSANTQTFNAQQMVSNGLLQRTSIVSRAAALGVNLLKSALTFGLSLVLSYGLEKLVKLIGSLKSEEEKLAEAVADANKNITEQVKQLEKVRNVVEDNSESYAQLAQGVNQFNGDNMSLTNKQYEQFLSNSNELAKVLPELVSYYTASGDAVLNLKGSYSEINDEIERALENQRQITAQNTMKDFDAIFESSSKNAIKAKKKLEQAELDKQFFKESISNEEEIYKRWQDASRIYAPEGQYLYLDEEAKRQELEKFYKEFKIDGKEFALDINEKDKTDSDYITWVNLPSLDDFREMLREKENGYELIYRQERNTFYTEMNKTKPYIAQWLDFDFIYSNQDSSTKQLINSLTSNIDWGKVRSEVVSDWTMGKQVIQEDILYLFDNKEFQDKYKNKMEEYYSFKNSGKTFTREIREDMSNFLSEMQNTLDLSNEQMLTFKVTLGIGDFDNTYSEVYERMINGMGDLLSGTSGEYLESTIAKWLRELDYDDLKLLLDVDFNKITSLSNLQRTLKMLKNFVDANTNTFDFSNETFLDNVKTVKDKISSLGDAYKKLQDDTMTEEDKLALLGDFPQLVENEENLASAVSDLISTLSNDFLEELIQEQALLDKNSKEYQGLQFYIDIIKNLTAEAQKTEVELKTLDELMTTLNTNAKMLNSVNVEITDNGKISLASLQDISSAYTQLTGSVAEYMAGLISEEQMFVLLEEAYQKDVENYEIAVQGKLYSSEEFYEKVFNNEKQLVQQLANAYDLDYKNWTTLEQAKAAAEKKLLGELAEDWAKYYEIILGANGVYQAQMSQKTSDDLDSQRMSISTGDEARAYAEQRHKMNEYQEIADKLNEFYKDLAEAGDFKPLELDTSWKTLSEEANKSSTSAKDTKTEIDWLTQSVKILNSEVEKTKGLFDKALGDKNVTAEYKTSEYIDKLTQKYNKLVEARKKLGSNYVGNVDVNNRPIVDLGDGDYATSQTEFQERWIGDEENGSYKVLYYTPILPDGTKLDRNTLNAYIDKILASSDSLKADKVENGGYGIIYNVQTTLNGKKIKDADLDELYKYADSWSIAMHEAQDKIYKEEARLKLKINDLDGLTTSGYVLDDGSDEIEASGKAYRDSLTELIKLQKIGLKEYQSRYSKELNKLGKNKNKIKEKIESGIAIDLSEYSQEEAEKINKAISYYDNISQAQKDIESGRENRSQSLIDEKNTLYERDSSYFQKLYDNGLISATNYYTKLQELNIKYYKNVKECSETYLTNELQIQKDLITAKQTEFEKMIDDTIKGYDREIKAIDKKLEEANKSEDEMEKAISAVSSYYDEQIEILEEAQEAQEKYYDEKIEAIDEVIDKMEDEHDSLERQINLEKAQAELERLKNNKTVSSLKVDENGKIQKIYEGDADAIRDAQEELENIKYDNYIAGLNDEKKALEENRDEISKEYEDRIQQIKDLKEAFEEATKSLDDMVNKEMAIKFFGSDWETQALNGKLINLDSFVTKYKEVQNTITNLEKEKEAIEEKKEDIEDFKESYQENMTDIEESIKSLGLTLDSTTESEVNAYNIKLNELNKFVTEYNKIMSTISSASINPIPDNFIGTSISSGASLSTGNKNTFGSGIATGLGLSIGKSHSGMKLGYIRKKMTSSSKDLFSELSLKELKPDEVPRILQVNEAVLTEDQQANWLKNIAHTYKSGVSNGLSAASSNNTSSNVTIHIDNVNLPDVKEPNQFISALKNIGAQYTQALYKK